MVDYLGVAFLVAWTASVWCMFDVFGAKASLSKKAVWTMILLIPVIGVVVWTLFAPKTVKR
ncbi:MAG: PLDc N-terminal domain-containing protein [Pseudomonadota bacterium]